MESETLTAHNMAGHIEIILYCLFFTLVVNDITGCIVVSCVAVVTEHTYLTWASACM